MKRIFVFILLIVSYYPLTAQTKDSICFEKLSAVINLQTLPSTHNFDSAATVVIFLSAECPLCRNIISTCNDLFKNYNIPFVGIITDKNISKKDLKKFARDYKPSFPLIVDKQLQWAKKMNATITPEVFVIQNRQIRYNGAVDNRAFALGQYRKIVTEQYLENVLYNLNHHITFRPYCTTAVGCYIFP